MTQSNVALVQKMYEYIGKGQLDNLRQEVFSPDIKWDVPGRNPLAGTKQGIDEVLAFLGQLAKSGLQVEMLKIDEVSEGRVVELHRVYGESEGLSLDALTVSDYQIQNDRITKIQDYLYNTHEMDQYFNKVYTLKPIPERLAN
ncbi:MAG: nuclear transport factor 2 family protein [Xenococcaceae cyanobacterium MO_234.B1]|nr:nuclear transport factor 2 family protein [Xenococcaceae cyanobacterium MO_234.B1]